VSTLEQRPAKLQLRTAMEARDLVAIVDSFAPDAVFRSPLTGRLAFKGRDQIGALTQVVLDVLDDFQYTDELSSRDSAFLVARARVGGTDIEMVDHIRLNKDGKIRELTVFFRPMPAIAVAMRVIGSGLARPKSRIRAGVIAGLTRPLGFLTRVGDRIGVRLIRPTI
jgi:hypothetical protein